METILIADDHELIRRGVRMIVESLPGKYKCVETASTSGVLQILASEPVHYAILDIFLSDGNILPSIQQITEQHAVKILIYSMSSEKVYGKRLLQKGVRGFLNKEANVEELERAVNTLLAGDVYMSKAVINEFVNVNKPAKAIDPIDTLSDRELEVVEYVALGMGTKEMSQKMNIDITTVNTYRRRAFEKLKVENAMQLKDTLLLYKGFPT